MAVTIQEEQWTDVAKEALPLMEANWDERRTDPNIPFDPWLEGIEAMQIAGALVIHTAREDGQLVGYISHAVSPLTVSRGVIVAHEQVWYVKPEHRGGSLAVRLKRAAEATLKQRGVYRIDLALPYGTGVDKMTKALGWSAEGTHYMKKV